MNCVIETRTVNSTSVIFYKGSPVTLGCEAAIGSVLLDMEGNSFFKKTGSGNKDWTVDNGPSTCSLITEAIKQTETIQTS